MIIVNSAIIFFVILELGNVLILYFSPDSKMGNGVAVFNPWFKLQANESNALFVKYLVNWIAGTKLIFIGLLLVILFTAGETTKLISVIVLTLAIATYYFKLHPIIRKLDGLGEITPKGYSKTLFMMITGFIVLFILAGVFSLLL